MRSARSNSPHTSALGLLAKTTTRFFRSESYLARSAMVFVSLIPYVFAFTTVVARTGNPYISVVYLIVILPVAWLWGWRWALGVSAIGVVVNVGILLMLATTRYLVSITLQGIVFYSLIGFVIGKQSDTVRKLKEAQVHIRRLRTLLPICASCKKIRDDDGYWHQVEGYIQTHTDSVFSHGLCPECMAKLYPEYADEENSEPEDRKARARSAGDGDDDVVR